MHHVRQLCTDIGCSPEDVAGATDDREGRWGTVGEICVDGVHDDDDDVDRWNCEIHWITSSFLLVNQYKVVFWFGFCDSFESESPRKFSFRKSRNEKSLCSK